MIHLNNAGSAYEIGRQHGASCPQAVRLACEAWRHTAQVDKARFGKGVELIEERLERCFPELLDEAQGIANGAGVTREQILILNCGDAITGSATRGCSSIGFAESDHGPLLGKTADWNAKHAEDYAAWQRYQPAPGEGYPFIHYGCAGTWWSEGGINEAGLGMVLNGLPGDGVSAQSVPTLPLARGVLQHCRTVEEALAWLGGYDVMYWGFNLILADRDGDLAFIEVVPGAQATHRALDYLIHTNHCLGPETRGHQLGDAALETYGYAGLAKNSQTRFCTLQDIVPSTPHTLAGMQGLLRHHDSPGAISQNGQQGMNTVYAMIVAPAEGKLWGAEGFPPDVPFVEYQI